MNPSILFVNVLVKRSTSKFTIQCGLIFKENIMNQRATVLSALAGALACGLLATAAASAHDAAPEKAQEKCYGVAKAGQNDCANLSGTHSCAGQATTDNSDQEWRLVPKGTCKTLGGKSAAEAKKK
jgi:uncharacterized membrane protein